MSAIPVSGSYITSNNQIDKKKLLQRSAMVNDPMVHHITQSSTLQINKYGDLDMIDKTRTISCPLSRAGESLSIADMQKITQSLNQQAQLKLNAAGSAQPQIGYKTLQNSSPNPSSVHNNSANIARLSLAQGKGIPAGNSVNKNISTSSLGQAGKNNASRLNESPRSNPSSLSQASKNNSRSNPTGKNISASSKNSSAPSVNSRSNSAGKNYSSLDQASKNNSRSNLAGKNSSASSVNPRSLGGSNNLDEYHQSGSGVIQGLNNIPVKRSPRSAAEIKASTSSPYKKSKLSMLSDRSASNIKEDTSRGRGYVPFPMRVAQQRAIGNRLSSLSRGIHPSPTDINRPASLAPGSLSGNNNSSLNRTQGLTSPSLSKGSSSGKNIGDNSSSLSRGLASPSVSKGQKSEPPSYESHYRDLPGDLYPNTLSEPSPADKRSYRNSLSGLHEISDSTDTLIDYPIDNSGRRSSLKSSNSADSEEMRRAVDAVKLRPNVKLPDNTMVPARSTARPHSMDQSLLKSMFDNSIIKKKKWGLGSEDGLLKSSAKKKGGKRVEVEGIFSPARFYDGKKHKRFEMSNQLIAPDFNGTVEIELINYDSSRKVRVGMINSVDVLNSPIIESHKNRSIFKALANKLVKKTTMIFKFTNDSIDLSVNGQPSGMKSREENVDYIPYIQIGSKMNARVIITPEGQASTSVMLR